jgi:hypothetical protein
MSLESMDSDHGSSTSLKDVSTITTYIEEFLRKMISDIIQVAYSPKTELKQPEAA